MEQGYKNLTAGYLTEWNSSLAKGRLFNITLNVVLVIIGTIGNTSVLYIYKFRLGNEKKERYFIPYLAVMDLMACIVTCVRAIIMSTRHVTFPSGFLCKILWLLLISSTSTSASYLLVICIFRYRKVCRLLKKEVSLKMKRALLLGMLVVIVILSTPSLAIYGERSIHSVFKGRNVSGITCSAMSMGERGNIGKRAFLTIFLILNIAIVVAMIIMYSKIGSVVYKTAAAEKIRRETVTPLQSTDETELSLTVASSENVFQMHPVNPPKPLNGKVTSAFKPASLSMHTATPPMTSVSRQQTDTPTLGKIVPPMRRAKYNFTIMFLTVVVIYVLTYVPSVVTVVVLSFRDEREFWVQMTGVKLNVLYMLSEFYIFNHVLNPFIYLYYDVKFRREILKLCRFNKYNVDG